MSETPTPTPAGWYNDDAGVMRWWDGTAWGPTAPPTQPRVRKRTSPFAVVALFVALIGVLSLTWWVAGIAFFISMVLVAIAFSRPTGKVLPSFAGALSILCLLEAIIGMIILAA